MTMTLVLVALLAPTPAFADMTRQPKDKAVPVAEEVAKSGATHVIWDCKGDDDFCTITWDPKDGVAVVYTDYAAQRQAIVDDLAVLRPKIESETATLAETRRALRLLLKLLKL